MKMLSAFQLTTRNEHFNQSKLALYTKFYEIIYKFRRILLVEAAVKAKMLASVLPTEKRLAFSFWTFFKHLGNHSELEKNEITKNFC